MQVIPGHLAVVVPVHHDSSTTMRARSDRLANLERCLASIIDAAEYSLSADVRYEEISVVVVDDHSPHPVADLVDPQIRRKVLVLESSGPNGQGAALNFAMSRTQAEIFAFTDSDCVVAKDWLANIGRYYRDHPDHGGMCGPNWLFLPPVGMWTRALTLAESSLMRSLTESDLCQAGDCIATTRVDCRNMSLRAEFVRQTFGGHFFNENGHPSVSGEASYRIKELYAGRRETLGFDREMHTFHEPIGSLLGQMRTYFARGRRSAFCEIYETLYGDLRSAFRQRYVYRHFIMPLRMEPRAAWYVWLVHGAFWSGIMRRKCSKLVARGS